MGDCRLYEVTLRGGLKGIVLENAALRVVLLPDKGADIYEWRYKPKDIDVLAKTPWGLRSIDRGVPLPASSHTVWHEYYGGGWQIIFPAGGGPSNYKGVEIGFHGESAILPWEHRVVANSPDKIELYFWLHTTRTPFFLERTVRIVEESTVLELFERITNVGEEEMHYMWGHHPAYGRPFLDQDVVIDIPAAWFEAHEEPISDHSRLVPGARSSWPRAEGRDGNLVDLSRIPADDERVTDFGYVGGLREGWYGVTNTRLGFGVGLTWPVDIFPYVWYWQELGGSFGFPWYGRGRIMGIEPWSSYPGSGLEKAIENKTARILQPGETIEATIRAVFFESTTGVTYISPKGEVTIRPDV